MQAVIHIKPQSKANT